MKTKFTQEEKQTLINRYLSGESVSTITADVGIARSTLYSWIKAYKKQSNETTKMTYREFSELKRKVERLNRIITILQTADCTATSPLQDRLHEIEKLSSEYNVNTLCEALKVAKGTYYNHIFRNKRDKSQFNLKCEELKPIIQEIYDSSHQIFGVTKITSILNERNYHVCENTVSKLMRDMGLYSIHNFSKSLYDRDKKQQRKRENILKQDFNADAPNKVWVSDVTQFNVDKHRFYICIIIDLFSRKVVAYHISRNNSTQLAKTTFKKAYESRRPAEDLLFHTDNGSNYLSNTFMNYLSSLGVKQSFSRAHIPYDNSVAESFFSNMKREELYRFKYPTVAEFKRSVEKYINFFNTERPHATLKYKTPDKYEAEFWLKH